jgi:ketosteroid isomerase-like protein
VLIHTKEVWVMKRSPEVEQMMRDFVSALEAGDIDAVARATSREPGVVAIGSDPGEYSRDYDTIVGLMRESSPEGSMNIRATVTEVKGYEEGDIGWADGTGGFRHDNQSVEVRLSAVARREDGVWRFIQSHASIGVPNARMFDDTFQAAHAASGG